MKITIIGAGTAGLASAILLKRKGHEIDLYDQTKNPGPQGAGILLQPTGQLILSQLGLLDSLKKISQPIRTLRGYNSHHKTIALLPYQNEVGYGVHRGNLFNLLLETAKNEGVNLHFNIKIDQLTLQQSNYSFPQIQDKPSDLIILANGPHIELLEQTKIKFKSTVYPWGALWAITPTKQPSNELRQLYKGTSNFIGLLPAGLHPVDKVSCESFFWSINLKTLDEWHKQPLNNFKEQVLSLWPECTESMSKIETKEQFLISRYRDTVLKNYHHHNLVVLGDSAHAMSPQLGQGVSLALLDSFALSECLNNDIHSSLRNYEISRKQHIQVYQLLTRWLTPLYQSNHNMLAGPRNQAIKIGMYFPWFRKMIIRTLSGRLGSTY